MLFNKGLCSGRLLLKPIKVNTARVIASRREFSTGDDNYKEKYDIIIAGGGMVGSTLACALGKSSVLKQMKILLLEGSKEQRYEAKADYSNRVVALNPNTKSLMSSLQIWDHVENVRVQPVRYMQVWDACSDALISFSGTDIMEDDVAYIVENDLLLHAVNSEIKKTDNVNIMYESKISGYELPKSNQTKESIVKMKNGDTYKCDLLIGADGVKSAVREAMGVQYVSWDYDQMGVVATLYLSEHTENTTAWQRFLPTGPVAMLPLAPNASSLVWSTNYEHANQLLQLPEEQFVDALNDAFWKQYKRNTTVDTCTSWVGDWLRRAGLPDGAARQLPPSVTKVAPGSRAKFPLGFGHSTKYVAPGVALVGDAAHRVHPLAGQGVNLGFGDVKELVDLLTDTVYSGLDVSHPHWMECYETSRQRHNLPTQLVIDALHRLYTVDLPPFVLLRSIGLQLTNAIQPVKKLIMNHATT